MFNRLHLIALAAIAICCQCCCIVLATPRPISFVSATATVPTEVQLSGAIVAAVEEETSRDENDEVQRQKAQEFLNRLALQRMYNAIQGRGKFHKQRKMLKYLYPLLVGVLIAKAVLIPLVLKMLTALSTTSFVMSKIALIAAGLLALRWIFALQGHETKHLEIVHVPPRLHYAMVGGGGGGGGGGSGYGGGGAYGDSWEDLTHSGSNRIELLAAAKQSRQKYIPIMPLGSGGGGNSISSSHSNAGELSTTGFGGAGDGGAGGAYGSGGAEMNNRIAGLYRYAQHNYNGKPFL